MSVKTVTLTVDAYDALAAVKEEGESFSQVVKRLAGTRVRLSDFAGAWRDVPKERAAEFKAALGAMDRLSIAKLRTLGRKRRHG